jgi:dUTP pyrophosphatase
MIVKIVNRSKHDLPEYRTMYSAGLDLIANLDKAVIIKPLERALIPTGIYIELPEGFEAQIRPRSGLAVNHGITVLNTPGTIDSDYRGEIRVILINLSDKDYEINDGERISQMIISRYEKIEWNKVDVLHDSERGKGGFGHTGNK